MEEKLTITLDLQDLMLISCKMFDAMYYQTGRAEGRNTPDWWTKGKEIGASSYLPISQGELEYELLNAIREVKEVNFFLEYPDE